MTKLPLRLAALASILALTAAACGNDNDDNPAQEASDTTAAASATTAHAEEEMMPLPDFAKSFKTAFTSPASGVKVTDNILKVRVAASGFELNCDQAGKPVVAGKGHYHLLIDKSLVNMYCAPDATVSMQNVKPGTHELEVIPAINDHAEVHEGAQTIKFDYEPTNPLPVITDETTTAKPTIKILSPKPGETLRGAFDVVVEIANFKSNCDLFGKPGVAGYGHWHVNLDSSTGPMMGMGSMLGMSCEKTFHATTEGLKTGETHTVIALLTDNGHAPLNIEDKVEVKIG
jgi:hypothetical protein